MTAAALQGRQLALHQPQLQRPRAYMGIDPGMTGAAVVVADSHAALLSVTDWKPLKRKAGRVYRVRRWTLQVGLVEWEAQSIAEIGAALTHAGTWPSGLERVVVAAEDLYVGKADPSAACSLGVTLGRLLTPLELRLGQEARLVKASDWRPPVLRLSAFAKREVAKAASLRGMPLLVPSLDLALQVLGSLDHITDAAGIAYWRRQQEGWR